MSYQDADDSCVGCTDYFAQWNGEHTCEEHRRMTKAEWQSAEKSSTLEARTKYAEEREMTGYTGDDQLARLEDLYRDHRRGIEEVRAILGTRFNESVTDAARRVMAGVACSDNPSLDHRSIGAGGGDERDDPLVQLRRAVREMAIEECARLFDGLEWLCLDHGGEEKEEIQKKIRSLAPIPVVSCPDGTDPDEPSDRGFVCEHEAARTAIEVAIEELADKYDTSGAAEFDVCQYADSKAYKETAHEIRSLLKVRP